MGGRIFPVSVMLTKASAIANSLRTSRSTGHTRTARAGQDMNLVSTMIAIVVAATIGYVGLTVMSTTESTTDFNDGSAFDNASGSLTSGVETTYSLVEVVFIAILLGLVVGALVTLRR